MSDTAIRSDAPRPGRPALFAVLALALLADGTAASSQPAPKPMVSPVDHDFIQCLEAKATAGKLSRSASPADMTAFETSCPSFAAHHAACLHNPGATPARCKAEDDGYVRTDQMIWGK